ncbi:MAG: class I SAM-dependent methyltransferase [Rhodothermales bacterium]|nr:class I SAM-dependent methyltransferase [Rhodothermales bacterium]
MHQSANLNKYTTSNRLYRWHIDAFHSHLTSLARTTNPARILDAGCGEGHLSQAFKSSMPHAAIEGIDHSHEAIEYARKQFGDVASFDQGDIHALPFETNSFDLVVCSQVLEHLDNPEQAITELKRVSRSYVLISVPLEPYFKFFNDISRALRISPDPGHVQFWTRKTFPEFIGKHFEHFEHSTLHYYQAALARSIT